MEGVTATMMETILAAAADAVEFSGTCLTNMIQNEVYVFILAAGFIGAIGLPLVRKLARTARF